MDRRRTIIGVVVSLVYLAVVVALSWNGREALFKMAPNEVGDFLAGIFGPLAVLWLILGYFQQGEELKQSTRALCLQAEELKNSVWQQQQLVDVSREQFAAQLEAFEDERARHRAANRPLLVLEKGMSVSDGKLLKQTLALKNFGPDAFEVQTQVEPQLANLEPLSVSSIRRDASASRLVWIESKDVGRYALRVSCQDALGNAVQTVFNVEVAVGSQGPVVHISEGG